MRNPILTTCLTPKRTRFARLLRCILTLQTSHRTWLRAVSHSVRHLIARPSPPTTGSNPVAAGGFKARTRVVEHVGPAVGCLRERQRAMVRATVSACFSIVVAGSWSCYHGASRNRDLHHQTHAFRILRRTIPPPGRPIDGSAGGSPIVAMVRCNC